MKSLTEPLLELESYQSLLDEIRKGHTPVFATGVIDVEKNHLLYGVQEHLQRPMVILTHSEVRAKEILEDMQFFTKTGMYYPAKDILFYSADVHSMEMNRQRFLVVEKLLEGKCPLIVASVEALLDRYPKKEVFASFLLTLHVGEVRELTDLTKQLVFMGYERAELVESPGQFAVRGGILDIYPLTAEDAVRIEFWDDEIDSIRTMDAQSQRSVDKLNSVTIFPMRELVYDEETAKSAADKMEADYKKALKKMEKSTVEDGVERMKEHIGENIDLLRSELSFASVGSFINYFYDDTVSLLSYLPEDTILCFDEPQRLAEHMDTLRQEYEESMKGRIAQGFLLPAQSKLLFDYLDILRQAEDFDRILLAGISQRTPHFQPKAQADFAVRSIPSFQKRADLFCEELQYLKKQNYRILVLAGTGTRAQRMATELTEMDVPAVYVDDLEKEMVPGSVWVSKGSLSKGFQYDYIRLAVFSDSEIFGKSGEKRKKKKKKNGVAIQSFSDLHIGDYVVHDNHGIGVFRGLEKISVEGVQKDYMKISYRDGGNLFVPVSQMDMIQKYIGSGGAAPRLNKLGGQDWLKAKAKARTAVKILAEDLVALYAKRAAAKGHVYGADTLWQREFEEAFPFDETDDQLNAIEDVKKDMESGKVMDRLVCGDVGYGKTEVAIRAAFKAVQDGKQVAYLVPTTILAQQHYNTFVQRMKDFPINIALMSRFRTPSEIKKTVKDLEKGMVDIVIGTHRVLSADVKFKDLGLLIIDEEQRFGVAHKEKIKKLKENVDVLTLTATPIPRTLHMSLIGIRDMSVLEEAPNDRLPIQTFVCEYNDELVREAIVREMARGGQVYYVYNRVNNIADIAAQIAKLVPEANVAYAHGQMKEHELERIMFDFINGEIDVLVSTTIIETGLDISNVNTMIIHDSDNLGLSQLYQLRGRVGRSNRNAYAFLMYKRDKMLKEVAEKRLAAIKEFTDLGSGFKIAMRDLEIRGAGNLLGLSQHGHMEAVGYDLYCKMLNEAVQNLKGIHTAVDFATVIDLDVDAYIPAEYIVNETQKLDIYKRIAGIETIKERDEMKDELLDRFGNIPKAVDDLLRIALIRMAAHSLDMTEIKGKNERITFNFRPDAKIDPRKIPDFLKKHKDELSFTAYGNPFFTYKYKKTGLVETDAELLMGRTEELLEEMKELVLETEPVQNN